MNKPWYETLELMKLVPDFTPIENLFIKAFRYYEDYNHAFEKVSFLEMTFQSEAEERKFEMTLRFGNVSSLELNGFGSAYNQLLGFHIEDLKESGFEKEHRYLVEDYENNLLNFYCESIKIVKAKIKEDSSRKPT